MNKLHIKTGDNVIVISGDDKGKKGKVVQTSPDEGKVIIEGVNIVTKHVKPRKQGAAGGLIKAEAALYACKVQHYCSKCDKGVRVKHQMLKDGNKIRACAKCGENL